MSDQPLKSARAYWYSLVDARFADAHIHTNAGSVHSRRETSLNAELTALQETVVRARKLVNSQSVTGRVPAEVLATIFAFVRDTWPPSRSSQGGTRLRFHLGWMTVTHVCSIWRETAVGTPNLWAVHHNILDTPLQFLPVTLLRAGNLHLDISIDFRALVRTDRTSSSSSSSTSSSDSDSEPGMGVDGRATSWLCHSVCSRSIRLVVNGPSSRFMKSFDKYVAPHLGGLRALYLLKHDRSILELSPELRRSSDLAEVSLRHFFVPWDAPLFSVNLTYLDYRVHSQAFKERAPSYAQLQSFLESMPSLRTLILANIVPKDAAKELITPPNLRLFSFDSQVLTYEDSERTLQLLGALRFPQSCSRFARIKGKIDSTATSLKQAVGRCIQAFTTFHPSDSHEMVLSTTAFSANLAEQPIWLASACNQLVGSALVDHGRLGEPICLQGPQRSYLDISGVDLRSFLKCFSIKNLRAVSFTDDMCDVMSRPGRWAKFGAVAREVRRAGVDLEDSTVFLHCLVDKVNGHFTLFPVLQVIVFLDTDDLDEDDATMELAALTDVVRVRKHAGTPLQELVVSKDAEDWGVWAALSTELKVTFI